MKRRQMIACLLGISIVFPIFGVEKSAYAGVKEHVCGERNPSIYNLEETVTKRGIIESQDTVALGGIVENPDTVTPGGIVENPDTVTPGGIVENPETVTGGGIEEAKKDTVVVFDKSEYKIPYTRSKKIYANAINKKGEAVKVTYKSANPKVAKVDEKGSVTGVSVGTTTITATAEGNPKATAVCTIHVYKQKKGWYETKSGKKYYVKKDGTRAIGYTKINGDYYYANKNAYMVTNKWKYIKISRRKYKLYFGEDGMQVQNVLSVIGPQKKYKIEVNITQNLVIVYAKDGKNGFIIPVKAMICSCGVEGHETRQGNYSYLTRAGKWHHLNYGVSGKYCTRYSGPYLFHSVTYDTYGDNYSLQAEEYEKLGTAASHGCIRLMVKDAKWIYNNYKKCSVSIFKSNKKAPLKKPTPKEVVKIGKKKAYDPTDPDCR